jgi:membrane-bound serine protease (ClpP class)
MLGRMAKGLLLLGAAVFAVGAQTPEPGRHAAVISIEGAIGAASSQYFRKARDRALEDGAAVIVLRIDTPGGLDSAMREIIKDILDAPVPVLGFVGPSGARAASAGTYLLYATHVAAMAPGTNLGAATPVPVGGGMPLPGGRPESPEPPDEAAPEAEEAGQDKAEPERAPSPADAMGKKMVNDAVAYIRGLAELRGRNADWAEEAVREGVSLSASAALERKVIDLVVQDVGSLLAEVDGREIALNSGTVTLDTAALPQRAYDPDWRDRILATLANPTVAYLLMLAGIYGLLLEGYNPGAILPGTVGGICLLLALFAFQVLPVNYAGLALMVLGLALMIGEALVPSFGVLGFGGIVAFVLGSVLLIDTDIPGYGVDPWLIGGIALAASLLLMITIVLFWRSRKARVSAGIGVAVGTEVEVLEADGAVCWGRVNGERWRLRSAVPLSPGQTVVVKATDGLTLDVVPLKATP